jgi:sugar phosphate isomerase/epimerase
MDPSDSFEASLRIPAAELSKIPLGYCTPSAGAKHGLESKLQAIAAAGFSSVEMGFPDLQEYATSILGDSFGGEADFDSLEQVAHTIHAKCEELGLYVATLMPFGPFGGFTEDQRTKRMEEAEGWFRIIKALGNPMLQCGTSDLKDASTNFEDYVNDLRMLADAAAKKSIRIAYEQWCWSTHMPRWQDSYKIVKAVDRPNCGVCLDTFQIAGYDWADPREETGLVGNSEEQANSQLAESLRELEQIDPAKVFYFQVGQVNFSAPAKSFERSPRRPRCCPR